MLKLEGGRSSCNEITYSTSNYDSTATRKEDDSIVVTLYKKERKEDSNISKKESIIETIIGAIILIIILVLENMVFIPFLRRLNILMLFYAIPTFLILAVLIIGVIYISLTYNNTYPNELFENHAAEHMVADAYISLKRIPTFKEAKSFGRISKNCGVNKFSAVIMGFLICFLVFYFTNFTISPIIMQIISLRALSYFPFNFIGLIVQLITTKKPNDSNIDLAILALWILEYYEMKSLDSNYEPPKPTLSFNTNIHVIFDES